MSRRTFRIPRLLARLGALLQAEPCPYWADYLRQKSRDA